MQLHTTEQRKGFAFMSVLSKDALDQIFLEARTRNGWQDKPVPEALLHEIYDIAKMGPTTANSQPQRILFVTSPAAKERLKPALAEGNRDKTMKASVVAIFAYDSKFYDLLPKLMPHSPGMRDFFAGNEEAAKETAFRSASLQAAYFIVAARAKGLDCGPMSGFDQGKVNETFFPDGRWKSNFICALGYGTDERLFARSPRLTFEEACQVA
jgi:3-hydroxypropanoate dehydrogenase